MDGATRPKSYLAQLYDDNLLEVSTKTVCSLDLMTMFVDRLKESRKTKTLHSSHTL